MIILEIGASLDPSKFVANLGAPEFCASYILDGTFCKHGPSRICFQTDQMRLRSDLEEGFVASLGLPKFAAAAPPLLAPTQVIRGPQSVSGARGGRVMAKLKHK